MSWVTPGCNVSRMSVPSSLGSRSRVPLALRVSVPLSRSTLALDTMPSAVRPTVARVACVTWGLSVAALHCRALNAPDACVAASVVVRLRKPVCGLRAFAALQQCRQRHARPQTSGSSANSRTQGVAGSSRASSHQASSVSPTRREPTRSSRTFSPSCGSSSPSWTTSRRFKSNGSTATKIWCASYCRAPSADATAASSVPPRLPGSGHRRHPC